MRAAQLRAHLVLQLALQALEGLAVRDGEEEARAHALDAHAHRLPVGVAAEDEGDAPLHVRVDLRTLVGKEALGQQVLAPRAGRQRRRIAVLQGDGEHLEVHFLVHTSLVRRCETDSFLTSV